MTSTQVSKKQLDELKKWIYSSSGIHFRDHNEDRLQATLMYRMEMAGLDFATYRRRLAEDPKALATLIESVTAFPASILRTNQVQDDAVSHLISHPQRDEKMLKIWCAACTIGDEPYSLAIQLHEAGISFAMLATDIDHPIFTMAAKGIYPRESVKHLSEELVQMYFQEGDGENRLQVKDELRQFLRFRHFNPAKHSFPRIKFDAILFQNLLIYFDDPNSKRLMDEFHNCLAPHGIFGIGDTESLDRLKHDFKPIPDASNLFTA